MGVKTPFSVRMSSVSRSAFEGLIEKVRVGRGADSASEQARMLLEEWMFCEYGLDECIRLGLLGRDTVRLPYPENLYDAIRKYESSVAST